MTPSFLNKQLFFRVIFCALLMLVLSCCFCACKKKTNSTIEIPQTLTTKEHNGIPEPVLKVFNTSTQKIEEIPLETYVLGVVAGEMPNDFPSEALKAQAILARTFALNFVQNNKSTHDGADISTDIAEAQNYAPQNINDAIIEAVAETQGQVLVDDGKYVETWFHSNSGGTTAQASDAFGFESNENHTKVAFSPETQENAQNTTWSLYLLRSEMLSALANIGKNVNSVSNISIGQKDQSGRALVINFGDTKVSASEFRKAVGGTRFKSTLIDKISVDKYGATFEGKGYGHGVGLSQWGAKIFAEQGKTAEDILLHYFDNVTIAQIYN